MNTYFKLFCIILFASSCDQDIDKFTNEEHFIYFNIPFKLNQYGEPTTERLDSIEYSFALKSADFKTHTVKIPINTISLPTDFDRKYNIEIVKEETTALAEDWNESSIENSVVKSGLIIDTLSVIINRTESMSKENKAIVLRLKSNDYFQLGVSNLVTVKIVISDILLEPDYWKRFSKYFGPVFHKEVYRKWMEIYHLGADPNIESISYAPNFNQPLWHGNMPYLTSLSDYYPSTLMFLGVLKKYFDENDVYPNADATKPPIRLPRF